MRVFLRHKVTGCYYREKGSWVRDRSGAHDFEEIQRAASLLHSESWRSVELIVAYGEREGNLRGAKVPSHGC
jgi:hypothetical protein